VSREVLIVRHTVPLCTRALLNEQSILHDGKSRSSVVF